jgi:hypothetical protein
VGLLALAGCGDNFPVTDPVLTGECIVTMTGNFAETSTAAANCATVEPPPAVGHTVLTFAPSSSVLGGTIGITLDLGTAPTPGRYSSITASTRALPWSAFAIRPVGDGGCVYSAGDTAVPPGSYTLALDQLDTIAHGTLEIVQHVLAIQDTDCGDASTETITIEF